MRNPFKRPSADYREMDDFWFSPVGGNVAAGVMVTREVVLSIPAAWRAICLIAESIASLPVGAFTKVDGFPLERPLPLWLRRPNPELKTRFDFISQAMVSLLLDANFYSLRVCDSRGLPVEMWPFHWSRVHTERDQSTQELLYKVSRDPNGGQPQGQAYQTYKAREILHIPGLTYPGVFGGISPVDKLAESLGLSVAVQQYAARYFGNGGNMAGLLTLDSDPGPDAVAALEEKMTRKFSGLSNSWKVGILAKAASSHFTQLAHENDKAQMLETRVHQVVETARIFGVPPHLLFEMTKETTWGSGIEQQGIGFVVYCLRPWLERLEQHLFYELPSPQYLKWNVNGLLRGDMKTRFEAYKLALGTTADPGWMTTEEIRTLEELPPLKEYRQRMDDQLQALESGRLEGSLA